MEEGRAFFEKLIESTFCRVWAKATSRLYRAGGGMARRRGRPQWRSSCPLGTTWRLPPR